MKVKVVSIVMMLLISGTTFLSGSIPADWTPGDEYKMHFPQLPDPSGWDVNATIIDGIVPYTVLADDWLCMQTGYVTDIHFWGSWLNDLVGNISAFTVTIFSDIPANLTTIPFSRPGGILWRQTFIQDDWVTAGPESGLQGWYDPYQGTFLEEDHIQYWQYNIENIEEPFYQEEGTIYWLSVSARVDTANPQPYWGWKSSDYHWNDEAVYSMQNVSSVINANNWINLTEPPLFKSPLDFSFVINGEPAPSNNPPNDPSKPNGPSTGSVGEWLPYTTVTTDPDGDNIQYGFDLDYNGIVDFWTSNYYLSGQPCGVYIKYGLPGTYYIRVKARDVHGATSGWSPSKTVVITGVNEAPSIPTKPTGPSVGEININYTFYTSATDPDGDDIKYGWDWNGDDIVDEWTEYYNSGEQVEMTHLYLSPGTYYIRVIAEDEEGAQSEFSSAKKIIISSGNPPNKPETPSGAIVGKIGVSYTYYTSTTDPDGDNIFYLFDWGDGTTSQWIGPYSSGSQVIASHIWTTQGSFPIKVKAKDDPNGDGDPSDGTESVWSESLPVTMPKTKQLLHPMEQFINNLIQNHPLLYSFIRLFLI